MYNESTIKRIAKVGKAPDTLARVPEMMDTPPILWFNESLGDVDTAAPFLLHFAARVSKTH